MLLAKEIEFNPTLKGFLKIKGKPDALEVEKTVFAPYFMYFYYPSQKERYVLEERNGDWVIRGPEVMDKDALQSLGKMPLVLSPATKLENLKSEIIKVEEVQKEFQFEEIPETLAELPIINSEPTSVNKKDILANPDEVDGDILHLVKYKGETLRLIAGWYTGQPDNASRIARINGFKDANALILDQKIRIPRYLVTKDIPLKKDDVEFYLKR